MALLKPTPEKQIADLQYEKESLQKQIGFRQKRITEIDNQITALEKTPDTSLSAS